MKTRTPRRAARAKPEHRAVGADPLDRLLSEHLPQLYKRPLPQTAIPKLAKDPAAVRSIEKLLKKIPTRHELYLGDARDMARLEDGSVHLAVTSPPYWTLKVYPSNDAQLGGVVDYDTFLKELHKVWRECFRVLVPGGRLIVVVGDVCLSRRKHGAHMVVPLHAAIQEDCRHIGFHNLAPIIWHKIANAAFEVENGTAFLGKPYEPNAVIKNDIEFILMQRKPGGYRQPSDAVRLLSMIGEKRHRLWFNQILRLHGASTRRHPAPYPVELVERLTRMFSFVNDTVLDPFSGTGTTSVAAARWGRHSIGFEIEPTYHRLAVERLNTVIRTEKLNAVVRDDARQ
ncbi:MAG: site-specific DNA-methyltransferase [Candidatus Rokubacteria bacterium]|nr:site-specific DNA-methyltransferase [Candidatus Rokubacteria bacterium]